MKIRMIKKHVLETTMGYGSDSENRNENQITMKSLAMKIPEFESIIRDSNITDISTAYSSPLTKKMHINQRKMFESSVNIGNQHIPENFPELFLDGIKDQMNYNPFREDVFSIGLIGL
jgi:hypothetical protein